MSDSTTLAPPSARSLLRATTAMRAMPDGGTQRVLVVDDEKTIGIALARFLRSRGYEVEVAQSGARALELLAVQPFTLMLCDIRMAEMSGLDVVPRALRLDADLAILMLTAVNDASAATEALASGAMDYLVKPIELADLQVAVERATHRRHLQIERRRVEQHIREEVALRTAELEKEKASLRAITVNVAEMLVNAMETKDTYLRGHSRRVAELAASVAHEMNLDEDTVECVRLAARLHDVGKIGIREDVLNKPGPLTGEEFAHVKEHVKIGMDILAPLTHIPVPLAFVQDHHEHFDGTGYPRGLEGESISLGGRILAACDAFDALTSRRAYREARDPAATITYLEDHVGRLLDPTVFAALRSVVLRRKTLRFIDDLHA